MKAQGGSRNLARASRSTSPKGAARDTERQLRETGLLLELARMTAGTLDVQQMLDAACDFLVKLVDVSHAVALIYDNETKSLSGLAASTGQRSFMRNIHLSIDEPSLAARVARERCVCVVENVPASLRAPSPVGKDEVSPSLAQHFHSKALLGLPLIAREELVGVIILVESRKTRSFGPALRALAEAAVGQLALSIQNASLYASLRDSYAQLAMTREKMVRRERLAALGEVAALVAHEVRNPLGVVFNAVAALRRRVPKDEESTMLLSVMEEEGTRLNRLVSELLEFARPREPELLPSDLAQIIEDSVGAAQAARGPEHSNVSVVARVDPHLPLAQVDGRLMRQAFINIIVNAMDAMPNGGVVNIRARADARARGEHFRVDFVDAGVGIPTERIVRIFEPFFTTKAQGTGLGLALVKRIIEEHHGHIEIDSEPGRGTRVTFWLPLVREAGP
ncbi:MAG: ATP-binding protein [Myxococcaceae bacterium]